MKKYRLGTKNSIHAVSRKYVFSTVFLSLLLFCASVYYFQDINVIATAEASATQTQVRSSNSIPLHTISKPAPVKQPQPVAEAVDPRIEALQTLVDSFAENNNAKGLGITIQSLTNPDLTASINPDELFDTASLYKTIAAYRALQLVDQGQFSLDMKLLKKETLRTCIQKAISVSDNPCGVELQKLSRPWELNNLMQEWGLQNTDMSGYFPTTTASDQALFYERLYSGKELSDTSHKILTDALTDQQITDRVPSYDDAVLLHKTGDLNGTVNSASVISTGDNTYIIVLLSKQWNANLQAKYSAIKDLHSQLHAVITNE